MSIFSRFLLMATLLSAVALGVYWSYPFDSSPSQPTDIPRVLSDEVVVPEATVASVVIPLNGTRKALGVTIAPRKIIADTRCPLDALCEQEGTVIVEADVSVYGANTTQSFELMRSAEMGALSVTLVHVDPLAPATPLVGEAYRFYFEVKDRTAVSF